MCQAELAALQCDLDRVCDGWVESLRVVAVRLVHPALEDNDESSNTVSHKSLHIFLFQKSNNLDSCVVAILISTRKYVNPTKSSLWQMKFTVSGANCDNAAQQERNMSHGRIHLSHLTLWTCLWNSHMVVTPLSSQNFTLFEPANSAFIEVDNSKAV